MVGLFYILLGILAKLENWKRTIKEFSGDVVSTNV